MQLFIETKPILIMKKVLLLLSLFFGLNLSLSAHDANIDIPLADDINTNDFVDLEFTHGSLSTVKPKPAVNSAPPVDLVVNVRVYLQGALMGNGNETGTTHNRPLMRDDLRVSPFNSVRYIPDSDPYSLMDVYSWEGNIDRYIHSQSGLLPGFTIIADPTQVFGVTGEDAIVDWVFIELRSKTDYTNIIATRSGLVQRDGDVVDLDGVSGLSFTGVAVDDYYVVVKHKSHLGAMTATAQTPTQLEELVDFTQASTGFFDFGTTKFNGEFNYTNLAQNKNVQNGYLALWGGDSNGNGKIKYTSPDDDLMDLFSEIIGYEIFDQDGNIIDYNYYSSYNLAFGYFACDFDMNSKAKYDNPNDDKNMVFGMVLFYPLNQIFALNFDFFIEQIPE